MRLRSSVVDGAIMIVIFSWYDVVAEHIPTHTLDSVYPLHSQ